jgi:alpha-N-arabinofuranosidase
MHPVAGFRSGAAIHPTRIEGNRMTDHLSHRNILHLHAERAKDRIRKNVYGHFAEHLGHCIYDGLWVGEDSAIPNTRGIRNDVTAALRGVRIPVLRWPGGCFADEYHWMDGIGPRRSRPTSINTHWGGVVENNHFGTHEYMELCAQLECEPYICGNVGSGTVREMQQWVEYLTSGGKSPMADLRIANGRADPWAVRFWGVGNESWGCGGNMRAEFYADQYRRFATFCRNFGENKLYKIACGASDADFHWTEVLMREAGRHFDGLSLHHYIIPGSWEAKGSATEFDEESWFGVMKKALGMDELIAQHAAIMDEFDREKRVGLIVDEWGMWYDPTPGTNPGFLQQQNTLRDALVAGICLNIFNNHADRVHMANLAQTVNVLQALILTRGAELVLTPTYHVFEMYQSHQDAALLPLSLKSEPYACGTESIPSVSASASKGSDGVVRLSLCNIDPGRERILWCELDGLRMARVVGRVLTAGAMNAHNTFEQPGAVRPGRFDGAAIEGSSVKVTLPAKSVVVLEIA